MEYKVVHNKDYNRFEILIGDDLCRIDYSTTPEGNLRISHTGVPKHLSGRGIAAEMTKFMLEYARENQIKILPICPYIRTYLERHPEYADVVSEEWKDYL